MPASAPSSSQSTSRRSTDTITGDPVTDSPAQESGVIRTRPFPAAAKSYLEVSTIVRGEGLLARTPQNSGPVLGSGRTVTQVGGPYTKDKQYGYRYRQVVQR